MTNRELAEKINNVIPTFDTNEEQQACLSAIESILNERQVPSEEEIEKEAMRLYGTKVSWSWELEREIFICGARFVAERMK